jgi:hypothetical protein
MNTLNHPPTSRGGHRRLNSIENDDWSESNDDDSDVPLESSSRRANRLGTPQSMSFHKKQTRREKIYSNDFGPYAEPSRYAALLQRLLFIIVVLVSANNLSVFACVALGNQVISLKRQTKEQNFYHQPELVPTSMLIDTETIPSKAIPRLIQVQSSLLMSKLHQLVMMRRYVDTRCCILPCRFTQNHSLSLQGISSCGES